MQSLKRHPIALSLAAVSLFASATEAIARPVDLAPPTAVGKLLLVHALRGSAALQAIERLHGKALAARDAYVAHYAANGHAAMLYVSRADSPSASAGQIERMAAVIRSGNTPFYHLRPTERDGMTVYSALGQGQIHYFYRRGAEAIWLAVDPPVAEEALQYLLQHSP